MPAGSGGDVRIEVDKGQLKAMLAEVKEFDPALARALRKQLRQVGGEIVAAMKSEVIGGPGGKSGGSHRSRGQIAGGLGVKVATAAKRQGVFITGSASKMGPGRAAMPRTYNKPSWRHPVFGTGKWVSQRGHPYFGDTVKRYETPAEAAIKAALDEALATVRTAQ